MYDNNKIMHSRILEDFSLDLDEDLIVKRCTLNQVVIESEESKPQMFADENQLEMFLKKYSKTYNLVFSIKKIGTGG